jgi:hypothetical protein
MARKRNSQVAAKATNVFLTVAGTVAARKGLEILHKQDFMQGDSGTNVMKLGANAGTTVAAGAGAVMINNDMASAFLTGLASGAATHVVEDVEGTMGLNGLGSVDLLDMYDEASEDLEGVDLGEYYGGDADFQLAGDESEINLR